MLIFGVPVSQPVRAVIWPCLIKKCPFKLVPVAPGKGTRTPDFLAMNPSGQIPAIDDNGFKMGESMAIMQYLAESRSWSDLWPADHKERARISMYMHYHHRSIRDASILLIAPLFNVKAYVPETEDVRRRHLEEALRTLDTHYLSNNTPYLAGKDLTLADLACYSELGQLLPQFHNLWDFSSTPNLQTWLARMAQVPHHDDVMLCNKILGDASSLLSKRETFSVESMVTANKAAIKRFAALSEEMRPE
jgi:glutathione S-transferase